MIKGMVRPEASGQLAEVLNVWKTQLAGAVGRNQTLESRVWKNEHGLGREERAPLTLGKLSPGYMTPRNPPRCIGPGCSASLQVAWMNWKTQTREKGNVMRLKAQSLSHMFQIQVPWSSRQTCNTLAMGKEVSGPWV